MDGGTLMSKLKLIKSKMLKTVNNTFWNTCPRKLEYMPKETCSMGIPEKSKDNRVVKNPECSWWINSEANNYCFWSFIKDQSNPDGSMKELVQSEISKLFGWSSAKTHLMLKDAMEELVDSFKKHGLTDELAEISEHFEFCDLTDPNITLDNN